MSSIWQGPIWCIRRAYRLARLIAPLVVLVAVGVLIPRTATQLVAQSGTRSPEQLTASTARRIDSSAALSSKVSAGSVASLQFTNPPTTTTAGQAIDGASGVQVTATDSSGQPIFNDTVTMSVNTGPGGFTGSSVISSRTDRNGVATFTALVLNTAGSYTLKATDSTVITVSGSFNVETGAIASVLFTNSPEDTVANQAIDSPTGIQVIALDALGNPRPNDTVTVSIFSGPGRFVSGTTTQTTNTSGIATFGDLVIIVAGSYTLTAKDGAVSQNSPSFVVSAGPVTSLSFTAQPTTTTAGQTIDGSTGGVEVLAQDAFGNLRLGDTVTTSVSSGPGGFASGSVTQVTTNLTTGVAAFSVLLLDTAGSYTLKATDGAISSPASSAFTVVVGPVEVATFTNPPIESGAGQPIDGSTGGVQVVVKDAFGNLRSGDTVTMSVNGGPGSFASGSVTTAQSNGSGIAAFTNLLLDTEGSYTLKATDGAISAISGSFSIVAATTTTVSCSPNPVGVGIATTCTATVANLVGSGGTTPTGTVSWTASGGGTFAVTTCTLNTSGKCSVSYKPNTTVGSPQTITANYGEDLNHAKSSGTIGLQVTPALVYLPFVANPLPQLVNGGFEQNLNGWSQTTSATNANGAPPISWSSGDSGSGTGSALLGSPAFDASCLGGTPGGTSTLAQSIVLPAGHAPTLNFSYRLISQDSTAHDNFSVYVNTPGSGTPLFGPAGGPSPSTGCPSAASGPYDTGWQAKSVSLQAYEGQTVTLFFQLSLSSDGIDNTYIYVDDVSVSFQ